MRKWLGRVVLLLGVLLVVGTGAYGARELFSDPEPADEEADQAEMMPYDCYPVDDKQVASRARHAFKDDYSLADNIEWLSGYGLTSADIARESVDEAPDSPELPEHIKGDGWVVLVMIDPSADLPDVPDCVEGTPVVYLATGRVEPL